MDRTFVLAFCFILFSSLNLFGQSTGNIEYDSVDSRFEFYNGSSWETMDYGTTGVGCSTEGSMQYNAGANRFEFCNGTNWQTMMGTDTTVGCSQNGSLSYDSANSHYVVCDGTTLWSVSSGGGGGDGYFVMSNGTYNGSLGGLTGADASCFTEVTTNNWTGKTSAGTITAGRVKAFLCDSSTCNNPDASTTYHFARAGDMAAGGATFTTDGSGVGPGDAGNWSGATYFNTGAIGIRTGRGTTSATAWSNSTSGSHCANWGNSTGGQSGTAGILNRTDGTRWDAAATGCQNVYAIICLVAPPPTSDVTPDAIDWANFDNISTDETITGINTGITLEISAVNGVGTPTLEYRKNGGSWTSFTTGSPASVAVVNNDTIGLRVSGTINDTATFTVKNTSDGNATLDTALGTIVAAPTVIYLTSGSSWTVPADWNDSNNSIEVIGGGGGGAPASGSHPTRIRGGGGGGGAYSKITNLSLTPSSSVTVAIGTGGSGSVPASSAGGDTWFNGASLAASSVGAKGGTGGNTNLGGAGGVAASGIGTTKYSGGLGGTGYGIQNSGGGGAGAAGPNGNGGAGSDNALSGNNCMAGGGGGGNGGGTAGSIGVSCANSGTGGVGGNNSLGAGGGAGGDSSGSDGVGGDGVNGGGGGGNGPDVTPVSTTAGTGGLGDEFDATHGSGGGGGGAGAQQSLGSDGNYGGHGGLYGGGGGGGGGANGAGRVNGNGGDGADGIIVITYTP